MTKADTGHIKKHVKQQNDYSAYSLSFLLKIFRCNLLCNHSNFHNCNLIIHSFLVTVTDYSYIYFVRNYIILLHVTSYTPTLKHNIQAQKVGKKNQGLDLQTFSLFIWYSSPSFSPPPSSSLSHTHAYTGTHTHTYTGTHTNTLSTLLINSQLHVCTAMISIWSSGLFSSVFFSRHPEKGW